MKQIEVKGLYEPARESVEGFVLICLKSDSLQDVCVTGRGGGGWGAGLGRVVSSHSGVAVS